MKDSSDVGQDCTASGWTTSNDESGATAEGWANFVAVASWWNDDMSGMEYDGKDVNNPTHAELAGSCGAGSTCTCAVGGVNGEGCVTQFFVDPWDENADDSVKACVSASAVTGWPEPGPFPLYRERATPWQTIARPPSIG
jgi:hypothetical protein